jgi:LysM repeat protein
VKEGEDVYAVAIRWGVSPAELKALNNLTSSDLQPGQVLKIPAVAAPAP